MKKTKNEQHINYPESTAFVGLALSVWNGNSSPAKVEMVVKGKLFLLPIVTYGTLRKNTESMRKQEDR